MVHSIFLLLVLVYVINSDLKLSNGTWKPVLLHGGDSISLSNAYWYKTGNLVQINILTWGSEIINPNDDNVLISLPFRPISSRNYGQTGFNSSGIEFHPAIDGDNNAMHFLKEFKVQKLY